jgi:hypothetical protein
MPLLGAFCEFIKPKVALTRVYQRIFAFATKNKPDPNIHYSSHFQKISGPLFTDGFIIDICRGASQSGCEIFSNFFLVFWHMALQVISP